jgi:hypothetical protein
MSWYRAYFLNANRRISDVEEFASLSDEQALDRAQAFLTDRRHCLGVELWQGARPIYLHPQGIAAAA